MKSEVVLYQWNTDCRDSFQLDCFVDRFAESKPKWMAKIAHGFYNKSPIAQKYNTEVCKRYTHWKEEKQLLEDLEDRFMWN